MIDSARRPEARARLPRALVPRGAERWGFPPFWLSPRRSSDGGGPIEAPRKMHGATRNRETGGGRSAEAHHQRFGLGVLTLFAASVLIFIGTEILPGDLASAILQNTATPETLAKLRLDLGLNQPAYLRFFQWLFGALHGDFGKSLANNRDVLTEIAPRFANTMFLAVYAAIVAVPLAIGLGLMAAIRQGSVFDRLVNIVTLMTISVPEYFPRLSPHQICRRRSRLVSLARERLVGHPLSRSPLLSRSCRC